MSFASRPPHKQLPPAVEVQNLRVDMASGHDIVADVSFSIQAGEVMGLVGESGSGKTTVGMALLGFARGGARIADGTIFIAGDKSRNMRSLAGEEKNRLRGKVVAYVPQDPPAALNPSLRIRLQLTEIVEAHEPNVSHQEINQRIMEVMRDVGLPATQSFLARFPHQLSGGQQQRIGIAMAVILKPKLLVLDEPTTGLDVTTQNLILDIVKNLCQHHKIGALYVTHDLTVVAHIADRVMVMYAGRVVETGLAQEVLTRPLHPYSQALLSAVPELRRRTRLNAIPGHAPHPTRRPEGCFFHPRCAFVEKNCRVSEIALVAAKASHGVRCLKSQQLTQAALQIEPDRLEKQRLPSSPPPLVEVQNLNVAYGAHQVLSQINFSIEQGECLAIVGESGSGKSTLSRALIGLVAHHKSQMKLHGRALAPYVKQRNRAQLQAMQYIFQSPHNSLNPRQRVENLIGLAYDTFYKTGKEQRHQAIITCLAQVNLEPETLHAFPDELSGGERQRVAIARALITNPQLLICDEITSALDVSVQAVIINLLKDLQRQRQLTLLFVTHNLALVRNLADRVLVLDKGHVCEIGMVKEIIETPRKAYTQELIANALNHAS